MIETISSNTGYFHSFLKKADDMGKETPESQRCRLEKKFKEEREKVLPIYNAKGKLIEHNKTGRYVDIRA